MAAQTAAWGQKMNVGWKWGEPRYLLAYTLGGTAPPPTMPRRDMAVHALDDPQTATQRGGCRHGRRALPPLRRLPWRLTWSRPKRAAPDLRESSLALNPDAFYKVVHDGVLIQAGMPEFTDLTRAEAE